MFWMPIYIKVVLPEKNVGHIHMYTWSSDVRHVAPFWQGMLVQLSSGHSPAKIHLSSKLKTNLP